MINLGTPINRSRLKEVTRTASPTWIPGPPGMDRISMGGQSLKALVSKKTGKSLFSLFYFFIFIFFCTAFLGERRDNPLLYSIQNHIKFVGLCSYEPLRRHRRAKEIWEIKTGVGYLVPSTFFWSVQFPVLHSLGLAPLDSGLYHAGSGKARYE